MKYDNRLAALVKRGEQVTRDATLLEGRLQEAQLQLASVTQQLNEATTEETEVTAALAVIQEITNKWQRSFEDSLVKTASQGISLVFGSTYELILKTKFRGETSTAEFALEHNGNEVDMLDADAGGRVVLCAFLLRVLLTINSRPALRRTLILDEPFAHLSPEYRPAAAALIRKLCDEAGMQVILVTQEPEYVDAADLAYEATQIDDKTIFKVIKDRQDVCYDA